MQEGLAAVRKIKFISACFAWIMILSIVIAAVAFDREKGKKQEADLVRQEVSGQIKRNMEKAVNEGNFSDYLEPSEVSFVVQDVCREDVLRYVVKIVFIAKTDRKLNDIQMKEAAGDMESLFQEFWNVRGKYITVHSRRGNGGIVSVINGKIVDQEAETGKKVRVGEQKRKVIRRKGCERTIIL